MADLSPRTVFLDRDGVLNVKAPEGDYVKSPAELELLPGAAEGVRLLNRAGFLVLVATNQRGIALGRLTEADVAAVHAELHARLDRVGARLDGIYHCPHGEGDCDCRKPRTGLFLAARRDHGVNLGKAAVVGDSPSDMLAAERIGARGFYVAPSRLPGCERVDSLLEAARSLVVGRPAARSGTSGRRN